jgi:hypothetical protein
MKPSFPFSVSNPVGLSLQINSNGSIRRMECGDININLFPGNEAEGGPINIHLRQLSETVESIPLLGPSSPATWHFDDRGMTGQGQWRNIAFRIRLILSKEANTWFWHVELNNTGTESARYDLIHTQDIGIAHYSAIRLNEYYVSQYIDHSPLFHPAKGVAIASRQNLSMGGRYPWTIIGSLGSAVSYATDALQFHALSSRAGTVSVALSKGLPGARLQHEHSMVCIQDETRTKIDPWVFHLVRRLSSRRDVGLRSREDRYRARTSRSHLPVLAGRCAGLITCTLVVRHRTMAGNQGSNKK